MRTLLFALIVLTATASAQSVAPQALNETINLAPRYQRGNSQKYSLDIGIFFLDDQGSPRAVKHNRIDYTQICMANNADSGLVYEVTIDSFSIGSKEPAEKPDYHARSVVDTLMGRHFRTQFRSKIPVVGNCYDLALPFTRGFAFAEAYELVDDFLYAKLIEQLRYTVGRQLSKVGDTVTITWPKPICYSIPKVINESRIDLKPLKLQLTGLTTFRNEPCATISIGSTISPYSVKIYSTDTSSVDAEGTSELRGEFLVSLGRGEIVNFKLNNRAETKITLPDGSTKDNRVVMKFELAPRYW